MIRTVIIVIFIFVLCGCFRNNKTTGAETRRDTLELIDTTIINSSEILTNKTTSNKSRRDALCLFDTGAINSFEISDNKNDTCIIAVKIRKCILYIDKSSESDVYINELSELISLNNVEGCVFPRNNDEQRLIIKLIDRLVNVCTENSFQLILKIKRHQRNNVELQEYIYIAIPKVAIKNTKMFLTIVSKENTQSQLQIVETFDYVKLKEEVVCLYNNLNSINDSALSGVKSIALDKLKSDFGSILPHQ